MTPRCAYCRRLIGPDEEAFAIHRDGFGVGPEVPLCPDCGGHPIPLAWDIWERIAEPSTDALAHRRVLPPGACRRRARLARAPEAAPPILVGTRAIGRLS